MPRTGNKWDQRIDRARVLAGTYPGSAEVLRFYAKLTAFQKSSYFQLQSWRGFGNGRTSSLPPVLDDVDLGLLRTCFRQFLSTVAVEAPVALAEFARGLDGRGPAAWTVFLREFWPGSRPSEPATSDDAQSSFGGPQERHSLDELEYFCALAFLQPYAEFLADRADLETPPIRRPTCPYCGSPPFVGVLRPEGEGAKRSLVCSFCRTEWDYLRISCIACEEVREGKLCVYQTPAFSGVRIDACDACGTYIKTIDLTQNGLAVPEVDELAAIPLTLWAEERGYKRVARNIMSL